jgi:hypothetical protein
MTPNMIFISVDLPAPFSPCVNFALRRVRLTVLGPAPLEAAQIKLTRLRRYLPGLIEGVAYLCKTVLAAANRMPKATRRRWQANAMRQINAARAQVRRCLKAIRAFEAELLSLTPIATA